MQPLCKKREPPAGPELQPSVGFADSWNMCAQRLQKLAVTLSLAVGLSFSAAGCGAIAELDRSGPAAEPTTAATDEANKPKRLRWDNVKSLNTGEIDASIVRCSLHGSVTFTRSDNCLAQGGTPAKI